MNMAIELDTPQKREQYRKNLGAMTELSFKYRGSIIDAFTIFEVGMELAIADYFTDGNHEKAGQLMGVLLGTDGFNFHNKRRLLVFSMKHGAPEFFKKHKTIDHKIQNINSFRNIVAHRKLDIVPEVVLNFDGSSLHFILAATEDNDISLKRKIITPALLEKEAKLITATATIIREFHALIKKA